MRRSLWAVLVVVGVFAVQGARGRAVTETSSLGLASSANANVSVASRGARVVAVWTARTGSVTDVYCATSEDAGVRFGSPVRVNDRPGDVSVYAEQPPRAVVLADAIVVTWASKQDRAAVLRLARSLDGGRSFQPATTIDASGARGSRGWQSMAVGTDGVHVTWLEAGRPGAPKAVVEGRWLNGKLAAARLTDDACDCCKTATATGQDGRVYVAWRHVYPDGSRDIAFAATRDDRRFAPPVRVSIDGWKIAGCPDDGPSLAVDSDHAVHVVWPSEVNGTIRLFHASTRDGVRFSAREMVPTLRSGRPAHPQLAVDRDGVVLVWDEQIDGARRIALSRLVGEAPGWTAPIALSEGDSTGVYPVAAAVPSGVLVAWTAGGSGQSRIALRRVAAPQ